MVRAPGLETAPRLVARSTLFDLFGSFFIDVGGRGEAMPLRVVVQLAGDLGVSEVAVRSAVLRMAHEGWLSAVRRGRESSYALTPRGDRLMREGRRRMFTSPDEPWDGRWCMVSLSVPEARRDVRDRMRTELSWLGFGSPASALYVSARDYREEVLRLADELDARAFVQIYRAEIVYPNDTDDMVARAWSTLDTVNQRYATFVAHFGAEMAEVRSSIQNGSLEDREAFRLRFQLGRAYRRNLYGDPELPVDLLPPDWQGTPARRLFQTYFVLLGPMASRYYDTIRGVLAERL